jgi:hypothetical protein
MTAAEISEGLARLGVLHHTTLPYSPYQYVAQPDMWRSPFRARFSAELTYSAPHI